MSLSLSFFLVSCVSLKRSLEFKNVSQKKGKKKTRKKKEKEGHNTKRERERERERERHNATHRRTRTTYVRRQSFCIRGAKIIHLSLSDISFLLPSEHTIRTTHHQVIILIILMDPSAYAALFPRERFERFVVAKSSAEEATTGGLRPGADGRPLGRARRVKIGFAELAHVEDDCGASVMCHLKGFDGKKGMKKTTVVCASRMERTGTNPRCPEEGFVEVNVEIASCSHAENSAHNADRHDRGATIGRVLRETVFSSKNEGLIDRKCLRDVQPGGGGEGGGGDKCWKLVVECLVIDDDMGTMDACLAAIVACLRKTRVPDATTTSTKKEDTKRTNDDGTKEKKKKRKMLEVNSSFKPVCLTVGAFNLSSHNNDGDTTGNNFNSKKRKMDTEEEKEKDTNKENEEEEEIEDYVPPKQIVVVDPTYEETKLCNALIHVIVDENGNVLGLEQSHDGASEVDETVLAKAIAAAKLRHGEVWKRIEQFDEMKEEEDEDEGE